MWITDWTNAQGDVVRYALRYQWPMNGPENLEDLQVAAIFTPARDAKEMRKLVLKEMSKQRKR